MTRQKVFQPLPSKDRPNIVTFISVGHASSHANATKYAGKDGVPIIHNNKVKVISDKYAPKIIHNIYAYPDNIDIIYKFSLNPVYFGQYCSNMVRCYSREYLPPVHYCDIFKANIGGDLDIKHHLKYFREMLTTIKDHQKVVLFGNCRGGAITLTSVAEMTPEEQSKISLVIVESVYTDVGTFIKNRYGEFFGDIMALNTTYFTKYTFNSKRPIDIIDNFPLNVPVGFIASKSDDMLNYKSTLILHDKLIKRGHKNAHLCILENSDHVQMPIHNINDQKKYLEFVDMLYDIYT
jgi:hypothetical protein